jgi:antitoxin (DNA-binding transcriptional repressor) of toxin-antitoxin stability system
MGRKGEEVEMQAVSIRDLMHNFSHYLKEVKEGEHITILERRNPVADIIPHNKNIRFPGWKRSIKRRKIRGDSFSSTTRKCRDAE